MKKSEFIISIRLWSRFIQLWRNKIREFWRM